MSTDTIKVNNVIDVNQLTREQVEQLVSEMSKDILIMVDNTINTANSMLNQYGLEAKMQIVIQPK